MDLKNYANTFCNSLAMDYQITETDQINCLVRISVGVGLYYIIETIKADAPNLKINRVVKDEVREVAGISISSLDKYIGQAFQSDRPIDLTTLMKLSTKLFYSRASEGDCNSFKYLKPKHIGMLGCPSVKHDPDHFISSLVAFIQTKPELLNYIHEHTATSKCPDIVARVFNANKVSNKPLESNRSLTRGSQETLILGRRNKLGTPLWGALLISFLGIVLPIFTLLTSSAELPVVLDYLVHEPGKHFFHIVILPCMVWALMRVISVENLRQQKELFWLLVSAGFVSSLGQTYVQHSQSICDLVVSDHLCNDIIDEIFSDAGLYKVFLIYSSFLSFLSTLLSIVIFVCQLLELRNRGREIGPPLIYALLNSSYLFWAVARSYSEWHEVALSFDTNALTDFAIYQYQSSLMVVTMLVISQIFILIQVGRNRAVWLYAMFFAVLDGGAFLLANNIQWIAPKLHAFDHTNFANMNYQSVIVGPLLYLYLMAIVVVFIYFVVANKVDNKSQNRSRGPKG